MNLDRASMNLERAERAEAELADAVRLAHSIEEERDWEAALADRLAEALRVVLTYHTEDAYILQAAALAAYEEARRES